MKKNLLYLGIISAIVLLWKLGTGSVCSWDEGVYGAISKEILKTGDWINLHWRGIPWSDKPPLYMWITAFFYKIFGYNEFSLRLLSALCGIGTVLLTYLIGLKLYSKKAGIIASLSLLTSLHFIWSSKMGMLDIPLTFFTTLSFLLFIMGEKNKIYLFLCPISFALAFLTKSMGAGIIPIVLFLYITATHKFKIILKPALLIGLFCSITILFVWHWAALSAYGDHFVKGYFLRHLFDRTTTALDGHTGDFLTYFGVIPNKGRPWAIIGFCLIPIALWRIFKNKEKEHILPVIWASTVLLLFSVIKTKLHWYIIPLYPALSLLTGWGLSKVLKKHSTIIVSVLACASLVYLSIDKGIFDLNYSPDIKALAVNISKNLPSNEKVYMYSISDPGMQFYMEDIGQNIQNLDDFKDIIKSKNKYAILNKEYISYAENSGYDILLEDEHYIVFKTK